MEMTDDEIRRASAMKLSEDRVALAGATETTPVEINAAVESFAASLEGRPAFKIPVSDDPHGRYGWCSDGVRLKVAADGGQPVYGWTIWEWGSAFLTAEFHCVWRSPTGDLIDITPKPNRETTIVFVEMPAYPPDFDFRYRPRNKRMRTYAPADVTGAVATMAAWLTPGQQAYEQRRAEKANVSLEQWLATKLPLDPVPSAIDELINACGDFEEYYDSLGESGLVRVDQKFAELMKRRLKAQERFKKLFRAQKPGAKQA